MLFIRICDKKVISSLKKYLSTSVIEIERKFHCTPEILSYCIKNSSSKHEIYMNDVYYDSKQYSLTTRDMWLRRRNEKLELKYPQTQTVDNVSPSDNASLEESPTKFSGIDFYLEACDLSTIASIVNSATDAKLNFPTNRNIDIDSENLALHTVGITPFGIILSNRVRYNLSVDIPNSLAFVDQRNDAKQDVYVDIDTVTYHTDSKDNMLDKQYVIGEIEFKNNDSGTSTSTISANDQYNQMQIMKHVFKVVGINPTPVRGKVLEYLYRFRPHHYQALFDCGQLASKGI